MNTIDIQFEELNEDIDISFAGEVEIPKGFDESKNALKTVAIPTVEIHISDISSREEFRRHSYISQACIKTIKGLGFDGYIEAIKELQKHL